MSATQKLVNSLRGLLQRYGGESINRHIWNHQYGQGRWQCLETAVGDCVYPHVEKHASNGSILDLGCGPGAVGNELNAAAYNSYTGIDICDMAIEKAKRRTAENHRTDKNDYLRSDMFTYVPKQQYDVILFGDSMSYFPHRRIVEMLRRYCRYLKPGGVIVVRNWVQRRRQQTAVRNIEKNFEVLEKGFYHESELVVLVFRLRSAESPRQ